MCYFFTFSGALLVSAIRCGLHSLSSTKFSVPSMLFETTSPHPLYQRMCCVTCAPRDACKATETLPRREAIAEGQRQNTGPTTNVLNLIVVNRKTRQASYAHAPNIPELHSKSRTPKSKKNTDASSSVTSRTGPCWHWRCRGEECQVAGTPPGRLRQHASARELLVTFKRHPVCD